MRRKPWCASVPTWPRRENDVASLIAARLGRVGRAIARPAYQPSAAAKPTVVASQAATGQNGSWSLTRTAGMVMIGVTMASTMRITEISGTWPMPVSIAPAIWP